MPKTDTWSYITLPLVPWRAPPRSHRRWRRPFAIAGPVLMLVAAAAQPAFAQAIRTTITPAGAAIRWDGDLGLNNRGVYGGSVGFEFSRWVSLQGYYLTNTGVRTDVGELGLSPGEAAGLVNQNLRLNSYGANAQLQLGLGDVMPYVSFGGGVLDFRPENGNNSRQIAFNLGGGIRTSLADRLYIDLFASDAMFRINRFALFALPPGGTLPVDPNADDLRHNLVIGGGLGIPFGPARRDLGGPAGTRWGIRGLSFALEPMVGQLTFDTRNIADQTLAGVRAGFDIGPLVGIRGFYWRGVSDNFSQTDPIQSWGGEAQFRFNSGVGITPFLLVGGGELDFTGSFRDRANQRVSDETSFIAGAGLAVPLGERFGIELAGRDYMIGERADLADVSSANDLSHNWMWSAGLRVNVGGRRGSVLARERMRRQERLQRELAVQRALVDSLDRELVAEQRRAQRRDTIVITTAQVPPMAARPQQPSADTTRPANVARPADTTRVPDTTRARMPDTTGTRRAAAYQSERAVNLPIPTEGELYVRYGPTRDVRTQAPVARTTPGAVAIREGDTTMAAGAEGMVSRSELREMVRDAVRTEGMDARLDAMRDELTRTRIDAMQAQLMESRMDAMRMEPSQAAAQTRQPTTTAAARGAAAAPTGRTRVRESAGEVEPRRAVSETRVPTVKEGAVAPTGRTVPPTVPPAPPETAAVAPRDTSMQARDTSMQALTTEVRSLLDSIRTEQRRLGQETAQQNARADSMLVTQVATSVDSIITARLAQEAARRQADSVQREMEAARARAARSQPTAQGPRMPVTWRLAVYGGANVSDGFQGVTGLRLDLGNLWRMTQALHVVPELAFGWGEGARSTLFAGNLQYQVPQLRIRNWPVLSPFVEGGIGVLNFSEDVKGHDGTDLVANVGYGLGIDLWRRRSGSNVPVLIIEHQGVDMFNLNRILAGVRWSF